LSRNKKEKVIVKYVKIPELLLEEIEKEFKGFQFSEVTRAALKLYLSLFQGKLNLKALNKDDK